MGLLNPNDVLAESRLPFLFSSLLGLRRIESGDRRWFGCLYPILLIILYIGLFVMIRKDIWRYYDSLNEAIYYFKDQKLQSCLHLVVVPVLILSSIVRSSDDLEGYKKLDCVDRLLFYLNAPIDHAAGTREEVSNLCVYVFLTLVTNLLTYFAVVMAGSGVNFDVAWILSHVPVLLEVVILCGFVAVIAKIRVRFERTNSVIAETLTPRKISVILVQSTSFDNASKLRLARRVHFQLHDVAAAVNKTYGFRMFFIFFVTLFSILNHFRNAIALRDDQLGIMDLGLHLVWICFHMAKYFYVANACHATVSEGKLAGGYFLGAPIVRGPSGLSEEMEAFSRQLDNKQLQFTLVSVFAIDIPKGVTIFIAGITYFLVLC
ncbi:uncharacterized protein LOC124185983 isoform X1 [Neodiprion fabricii]|uniref:uncharacterized protein LOC124185983 isoform X1 n=1 Tax=Neodiprion fabricii TaxID=2872261 RepID=UPI001ED91CC2|nr:uncharacterized protein LOC124185983 isoform X1 [Neodiprion fabricii]